MTLGLHFQATQRLSWAVRAPVHLSLHLIGITQCGPWLGACRHVNYVACPLLPSIPPRCIPPRGTVYLCCYSIFLEMPSPPIFPAFKVYFEQCIFHEALPLDATTLFLNLCDALWFCGGLYPTLTGSWALVSWISPSSSRRWTDKHFSPTPWAF